MMYFHHHLKVWPGALRMGRTLVATILIGLAFSIYFEAPAEAAKLEKPQNVDYSGLWTTPAPEQQSQEQAAARSASCLACHTESDAATMHVNAPSVVLGCADCHGGRPDLDMPTRADPDHPQYAEWRDRAHVQPRYPNSWGYRTADHPERTPGANPQRSYTLLNRESPEFIRFVNPSDYRIAREACGSCHLPIIQAAERSLMATGAMLWGGASYNNGILPYKNYVLGEAYTREGKPAALCSPGVDAPEPVGPFGCPKTPPPEATARGALAFLAPLPTWHVLPAGDVFRVFERGGRNIVSQFPEIGLPNALGQLQRIEEPGRPDIRQSNRGLATGLRVAIPALNIHKTRLNDPFTWFMGTNDQPGDYRTSGCAACHVVYANDREPRHSLTYAAHGRDGETATVDPTIRENVSGHPIRHQFTRAIPTSQCMICHMHQPNMFMNTYLGYTMWDYESDAPHMWPEDQAYPNAQEVRDVLDRNPEGAAPRGRWADLDFLRNVYDLNPDLQHTQFADYHGHGWNFRAILKRDREGRLLDAEGAVVADDDPEKWRREGEPPFVEPGVNPGKTVHMMDIHAEKGMQCVDCHFAQDGHGNGFIHGEVANAVEIGCVDCHGTADAYPSLRTSGPAASPEGRDLSLLRNPDGRRRFEWRDVEGERALIQRSVLDPDLEWRMSLTRDSVDPTAQGYNAQSARAKLTREIRGDEPASALGEYIWSLDVAAEERAHKDDEMACYTCHLSWTTSCAGCHLPIEANVMSESHHYEGGTTRNYATYNPQVAREEMFQLGRHQTTKDNIIAPVRSSSALILTSTNINRERIYVQQPPISSPGFSSQAFAPHFPHTVRLTETKQCEDCHVAAENNNNAIMAQLLLLGTNYVNFVGMHAYVGLDGALEATRVTEFDEPQAVFGSYLHRYAYPDYWRDHVEDHGRELVERVRGQRFDETSQYSGETRPLEEINHQVQRTGGPVNCLQHRGEYLFVAEGGGGFKAYDIANVSNKGVSERIVTGPFSPLGHDTHVPTTDATCMALPTNQPIAPQRMRGEEHAALRAENQEQDMHPLYSFAVVTDAVEGLVLVDVETLADREPQNNQLDRAVLADGLRAFNPGGALTGARHVTLGGTFAYVAADIGLVVVDLDDPLSPRIVATAPVTDMRASALQFRYLFVTDAEGLIVFDVTDLAAPRRVEGARVALQDAHKLYLARTYAYVAAGPQGLAIVDIERAEAPRLHAFETAGGRMTDVRDVVVASTNASLFAYVADGAAGLKVLQLTSPDSQPNFYGFSPEPRPELIAWRRTPRPALAVSKGLDRDRAVDETGHQIAVFGRLGSRPFTRPEMERFFQTETGALYTVSNTPPRQTLGASSSRLTATRSPSPSP